MDVGRLSTERESERAEAAFRSNERAATVVDDDVKGLSSSSLRQPPIHALTLVVTTAGTRWREGERGRYVWREARRCRCLWIEDRLLMADLAFNRG